ATSQLSSSLASLVLHATPTTQLSPLSLHDALPIWDDDPVSRIVAGAARGRRLTTPSGRDTRPTSDRVREAMFTSLEAMSGGLARDRKSTRLNSSHVKISYAVFCLKKKK